MKTLSRDQVIRVASRRLTHAIRSFWKLKSDNWDELTQDPQYPEKESLLFHSMLVSRGYLRRRGFGKEADGLLYPVIQYLKDEQIRFGQER